MYMPLLLAVALFFLLQPAAASPVMGYSLPVVPMESYFPDTDDLLSSLCQCCAQPFFHCVNAVVRQPMVRLPHLYSSFHADSRSPSEAEALKPVFTYVNRSHRESLRNENIHYINANETTVQPETVQAHIDDTYTPGDRLDETNAGSRTASHRRHAPRPRGFPCPIEGCEKAFDRACDVNRHRKSHLESSERPHQCQVCHEGFLYPKDLNRHRRKHDGQGLTQPNYYCHLPGCNNFDGFSRRDNLLRHQRRQHRAIAAAA
ncbi:hypothetical protein GQ44DRAFT_631816 [Phaeosphaeriaceae sp. PMI808]|nr:hypothetical protein GQ44DRAFT_631816 [Phaeosphaeriaceae sp. PMI808]